VKTVTAITMYINSAGPLIVRFFIFWGHSLNLVAEGNPCAPQGHIACVSTYRIEDISHCNAIYSKSR
ncbi:MAG: hypothetical protein IJN59_04550, partial [Oscillospiraceae bacterium]|nr:hypothetical protein [Oscillospiraceae bacterium]